MIGPMPNTSIRRMMLRTVAGPKRSRSPSSVVTWMLTIAFPSVLPNFHSANQK